MSAREIKKGKEGKGVIKGNKSGDEQKKAGGMKDFEAKRGSSGLRRMGVKDAKRKVGSSERGDE
jgi:hypothetical protein